MYVMHNYLSSSHHTTYQLGFPCLTELQAAPSEGPYLSPLPRYQQLLSGGPSVVPSSPPQTSLETSTAVGPGASTTFFSPLYVFQSFGGSDNQAAVRVKGSEKGGEKMWKKKERKKRKKKRPHQQCCQVYNKCASYFSFLLQK